MQPSILTLPAAAGGLDRISLRARDSYILPSPAIKCIEKYLGWGVFFSFYSDFFHQVPKAILISKLWQKEEILESSIYSDPN